MDGWGQKTQQGSVRGQRQAGTEEQKTQQGSVRGRTEEFRHPDHGTIRFPMHLSKCHRVEQHNQGRRRVEEVEEQRPCCGAPV
jgi:hypothetical protein